MTDPSSEPVLTHTEKKAEMTARRCGGVVSTV